MNEVTTAEFLNAIFEDVPDDETVVLWRKSDKQQVSMGSRTFQRALNRGRFRPNEDWHFCISTVRKEADEGFHSRKRVDCRAAYCIVLDDIGTKVDGPDLEPSWKLETSEGNFQWGYLLHPEEDLQAVEAAINGCIDAGITDGGSGGVNRVVRMPGVPHRTKDFMATLQHWDPSRVWDVEDLIKALGVTPREGRRPVEPVEGLPRPEGVVDVVLAWLHDTGRVLQDGGGDWVDVTCPDGEAHSTGGAAAGYSPLGRGLNPYLRGFNCFHEHAGRGGAMTTAEFLEWVAEAGGPRVGVFDPLPILQQRYAVIAAGAQVADMWYRGQFCWLYAEREFRLAEPVLAQRIRLPGRDRPVAVATAFMESNDTQRFRNLMYRPDCPDDVVVGDDRGFVNSYIRPVHEETEEPPATFLAHVAYLLPDEEERAAFLDWVAFKIQNPGRRSYAVVMVAPREQGIGRSWLGEFFSLILGAKSVPMIDMDELTGRSPYNSWKSGSQIVVIDEAKATRDKKDHWQAYERLKSDLDMRVKEQEVNHKYGGKGQELVFYNCLIFSNHVDALPIDPEDRRFAVLMNPEEKADKAHYDRLHDDMLGEAARAFWWLMRRDLSQFNPIKAPMTRGKDFMISSTRSAGDEVEAWVKDNCHSDLVIKRDLARLVQRAAIKEEVDTLLGEGGMQSQVERIWRLCEPIAKPGSKNRNGRRVRIPGDADRHVVRALRNASTWVDASDDEVVAEVLRVSQPGDMG